MQKIDKEKSCVLMLSLLIALFVYQYVARSVFPSVLANEYMKFFNLNAKSVSTLISCYYFLYVFLQIPAGLIVDRFSIRLVSTLSALLCATGILLFVSTSNYYIACLGQMLAGFGASSAFISTIKAVIEWFPENKHSILISISASIGGIGPVIFGPLVTLAVKGIHWRIVILMYSLLGFLLALSIWFLVKNKPNEEIRASKSTHKSSITLVDSLKMILFSPQAWVLFLFSMAQHAPITAIADSWGTSFIKRLYNL
jgi:MFS family permease